MFWEIASIMDSVNSKRTRVFSKATISFLLFAIVFFVTSCVVRKPYEGEDFYISDSPYHLLLTMESYKENPISIHEFLPIQTLGAQYNKYIDNGPSILHDKLGNAYYVTYSPMGFYVPYLFCKILGLSLNLNSIYYFNCFLMLICGILCSLIIRMLFKNRIFPFFAFIAYIFVPEVLYTQGIVYWHQSLSQVFLLLQILIFTYFIKGVKKHKKLLKVFFLVISFLFAYTEWTGIISNIGFAICALVWKISANRKGKQLKLTYDHRGSTYILLLGGTTVLSLVYFFWRFSRRIPVEGVLEQLTGRAEFHANSSVHLLFKGYIESYGALLVFTLVLIILALSIKSSRIYLIGNIKKEYVLLLFAALFPMTENLILREHALIYTFDRLKLAPFLILVLFLSIRSLQENSKLWMPICGICLVAVSVFGLMTYDIGKTRDMGGDYKKSIVLRDYLQKEYLNKDEAILVKCGQRAWGYLQTFYHRNIFCTSYYSPKRLIAEANGRECDYIIYLPSELVKNDTGVYKEAEIYNKKTGKIKRLEAINGGVHEKHTVHCRPYSDSYWSNGILKKDSTHLLFEDTPFNRKKIEASKYLIHDGRKLKILSYHSQFDNITVIVDKSAEGLGYPTEFDVK